MVIDSSDTVLLSEIAYNGQLTNSILLFMLGTACAIFVCFIMYKMLRRFI